MKLLGGLLILACTATASADSTPELERVLAEGDATLAAGELGSALESFRRAVVLEGRSVRGRIGVAQALVGLGDQAAAIGGLLQAAERWNGLGLHRLAAELLEAAAKLAPEDTVIASALGRTLVLDRRFGAAQPVLVALVESGRSEPETLLYLGAALWENGDPHGAETVLARAVEASGGAFPARYQLGRLYLWQSRYSEALPLLEGCAAQAPEAVDVRIDLARALDGAGRSEAAIAAYREAVARAPEHSELRYGLAMALLAVGDRAAAQTELGRYQELYEIEQERTRDEGLAAARIARGRELLERGEVEAAIEHLRDLPESANGLAALAGALRSTGDLEGAAEVLGRAVALDGSRADLRALLNETRLELLRR